MGWLASPPQTVVPSVITPSITRKVAPVPALSTNVHDCALVFEGGGYRASYSAGLANVLLENDVHFDFVCGISAGASHSVDYLSRDQQRVRDGFIKLTTTKDAGGVRSAMRGTGYFNADYDYLGCAEDGFMPFDWETFQANPARLKIQSFEADTGRSVRWTKDDMPDLPSMMERVRASSTLPVVMIPIKIDGHVMYDGGLGAGAGLPTHLALEEGFKKILFVATRQKGYRKKPPREASKRLFRRMAGDFEPLYKALVTRNERYNQALDELRLLEHQGRAFVWRPDVMPVTNMTIKTRKLERSYEMGLAQARRDWPLVEKYIFG